MRGWLALAGLLAGMAAWSAPASASTEMGCGTVWTLEAQSRLCASRVVIGPGNDTRVNMLLLLRDRAGLPVDGDYPQDDPWYVADLGRTFFDWSRLTRTLYPQPEGDAAGPDNAFGGTRCQSVEQGGAEFLAAADRNRRINARDRARLAAGRAALLAYCQANAGSDSGAAPDGFADMVMPSAFSSDVAREFGIYVAGAASFYAGDWRGAKARFGSLRNAHDPWVREAARYMEARNALGEAAATGMDDWGYFNQSQANDMLTRRSVSELTAYLDAYPAGRYVASARGLLRRARWLQGEGEQQAAAYGVALGRVDAASVQAAELIEEIDDKFLFKPAARQARLDPLLLATMDLLRMRRSSGGEEDDYYGVDYPPPLAAAELDGQQAMFAEQPELYAFLQANHAFYVAQDYRRVLQLLPDDARRTSYSPLQFSRQVLRGMALARLHDRNEVGFWRELLGGASAIYQRPTVELGLALAWERAGQVERVFAEDSPITDLYTRAILLQHSAGPEVLRTVARGEARTGDERDLAAYVLVYRELRRGQYAAARQDMALTPADGPTLRYNPDTYEPQAPVGVYLNGRTSDGYACPALTDTLARLARNARDVQGRLCLGDFFRLNGFDQSELDWARDPGSLGSLASYPGEASPRSRYYADIIIQPGVPREDRAYALYRAIHCYAPSGNNTCGGEEVEESQRAAWFRRLKNEFGNTRWGQEADYYW